MTAAPISETYFTSPQISPDSFAEIKAFGIHKVICNRPDVENPPELQSSVMEQAAKDAGLEFAYLPLTHNAMTLDVAQTQKDLIANSEGPVLAYCASGTRSTVIWAIGVAKEMPVDDILNTCQKAGYPLEGLRPTLNALQDS